jgi:hypothetical protein
MPEYFVGPMQDFLHNSLAFSQLEPNKFSAEFTLKVKSQTPFGTQDPKDGKQTAPFQLRIDIFDIQGTEPFFPLLL